jgi:hypothetical protein
LDELALGDVDEPHDPEGMGEQYTAQSVHGGLPATPNASMAGGLSPLALNRSMAGQQPGAVRTAIGVAAIEWTICDIVSGFGPTATRRYWDNVGVGTVSRPSRRPDHAGPVPR